MDEHAAEQRAEGDGRPDARIQDIMAKARSRVRGANRNWAKGTFLIHCLDQGWYPYVYLT